MLRSIFHKCRHLLHLLFNAFRSRLALPGSRLAVAAAVHTFGDYLLFQAERSFSNKPTTPALLLTAGQPIRLKFAMRSAKLFAFHFS